MALHLKQDAIADHAQVVLFFLNGYLTDTMNTDCVILSEQFFGAFKLVAMDSN
jgi:hypothetical protein